MMAAFGMASIASLSKAEPAVKSDIVKPILQPGSAVNCAYDRLAGFRRFLEATESQEASSTPTGRR